jgi:hypothetical protein
MQNLKNVNNNGNVVGRYTTNNASTKTVFI